MRTRDSVQPSSEPPGEIDELRHSIRDLISITLLPSVWQRMGIAEIAESLADVHLALLRADLVFVRLESSEGLPILAVRAKGLQDASNRTGEIASALSPRPDRIGVRSPRAVPDLLPGGALRVIGLPIGVNASAGLVAIGSLDAGFPSERERLLFTVAVSQAAASIAHLALTDEVLRKTRHTAILGERNRLAREMHDTLAQDLSGIVIQLQLAERSWDANVSVARSSVVEARTLAEMCLAEARRSVEALRPGVLEHRDLAEALNYTVAEMQSRSSADIQYRVEGVPTELPADVEINLLRICREALLNSLRHAHATQIEVLLTYKQDGISIRIQDNGVGFDAAQAPAGAFGLIGIRERVEQMGAELTIKSLPGMGASIEALVSLQKQERIQPTGSGTDSERSASRSPRRANRNGET
jgi:signal transduction histidine kinase